MGIAAQLGTSPMMLAYAAVQAAAPSHLILYRVGEFYEVLGQNADLASRALGLQLTRRRQKGGADVPMCGIPFSTSELAVARLLANGHKVAVSEQPTEDGGGRPLRRVSPATSVDVNVVPGERTNNLTIALTEGQVVAFAWVDLSTGEASATTASLEGCGPALARIAPTEILVARWPDGSEALAIAVRSAGVPYSDLSGADGIINEADTVLEQGFGTGWQDRLRGFSPTELAAMAVLLDYVRAALRTPSRAASITASDGDE